MSICLRRATGLSGINLGAWRVSTPSATYGDRRVLVRELIALLEAQPARSISGQDLDGTAWTRPASEIAGWLRSTFLVEMPTDDTMLPVDEETRYVAALFDSLREQIKPWYRKRVVWGGAIITLSTALSMRHGYKRNRGSWGWAFGWGVLGFMLPIITPAVALAQGYGKPKGR